MKKSKFQERSKLPEEHIRAAERLRAVRVQERFSQAELARELGQERSSLANCEYGRSRIPFSLGMKICRRLDLNPRWLATGQEPQRPYVPIAELGIDVAHFERVAAHSTDFLDGYDQYLAEAMGRWLTSNPQDKIIARMFKGGPAYAARRASIIGLETNLASFAKSLVQASPDQKLAILGIIDTFASELRRRLEATQAPARRISPIP